MTTRRSSEGGFTLIEMLVAITLLSVALGGFYSVMFSGTRGAARAQNVADIGEEARLGLNRLIRDTRQASDISAVSPTSYSLSVDFDGNTVAGESPNSDLEEESLTFAYNAVARTIELNGETLIEGVDPLPGVDMFSYSSNLLEYDWNNDGVTTLAELDAAASQSPPVALAANKSIYLSNVSYQFTVTSGDTSSIVRGQAELRNHDST